LSSFFVFSPYYENWLDRGKMEQATKDFFRGGNEDYKWADVGRDLLMTVAQTITYKKGDTVIAEGDLFQRLYQLRSGACDVVIHGKYKRTLPLGGIFGVINFVQLRPSNASLVVTSETADVMIIPAHKLLPLIEKDPQFGVRWYRFICGEVDRALSKIFSYRNGTCDAKFYNLKESIPRTYSSDSVEALALEEAASESPRSADEMNTSDDPRMNYLARDSSDSIGDVIRYHLC